MPNPVDGRGVKARACSIAQRRVSGLDATGGGLTLRRQGDGAPLSRSLNEVHAPARGDPARTGACARPQPDPRRRSRRLDGEKKVLTASDSRSAAGCMPVSFRSGDANRQRSTVLDTAIAEGWWNNWGCDSRCTATVRSRPAVASMISSTVGTHERVRHARRCSRVRK